MRVEVLVYIKDKIRGQYLGRHMDHLADSIAKLSQGRENWYIGREGIPVDDSSGEKCVPVIVFECMDLSIGQRVNVSGLSCVSNKVLSLDRESLLASLLEIKPVNPIFTI